MKAGYFLVVVLVFCQASYIICKISSDFNNEWTNFKQVHGKKYKNPKEEQYHMKIYKENKKLIEDHNKKYADGLVSFHLKMNFYGDLKEKDLDLEKFGNSSSVSNVDYFETESNLELPEYINWREKGAVTPVKTQGHDCHSCWAFCVTGALEALKFINTGKLVSLSEQQLLDCSNVNNTCDGGDSDKAFEYVRDHGGIVSEDSYPYKAVKGQCRFKETDVVATCSGFVTIKSGDEEGLKQAVATVGPVIVAIDASTPTFRFYSGGYFYDTSCKKNYPNHGVLVVGYGSDNGHDYWLVKNSWGTDWGENGYGKMARNKNTCGLAFSATYPVL